VFDGKIAGSVSMLEILLVITLCVALLLMTDVGRRTLRMCPNGYPRLIAVGIFVAVLIACFWSLASRLHFLHSPDDIPQWFTSESRGRVKPDADGDYFYGIMFDAGSTGSRLHVYKFHRDDSSGKLQCIVV